MRRPPVILAIAFQLLALVFLVTGAIRSVPEDGAAKTPSGPAGTTAQGIPMDDRRYALYVVQPNDTYAVVKKRLRLPQDVDLASFGRNPPERDIPVHSEIRIPLYPYPGPGK